MLEVKDLTKEFHAADIQVKAVDTLSFQVPAGSFAAIVGKSGSGKSTLLALLGALERPSHGSIKVDDQDITKLGDSKLIRYRREKIGFIFQHYNLIPNLTALENVMLPMEFAGLPTKERRERAEHLLNEVGLTDDKQHRRPGRLSGGEQQRVSIARALANKPKLILADEPTGNLDSNTSKMIVELLRHLAKTEQTTILVVTHDLNITKHTDMTFQLKDGKLIHHAGHIKELVS
ncbi:MAG TPA: ABC transporter ATP-binding protein [Patescibacteria group bacterium]